MTNEQLLRGLRQHDKRAIQHIFDQCFPSIRQLVVSRSDGASVQDAEDIFMSAIEAVYLKLENDDLHLTCQFSTFFISIAKNLWLNELRRRGRQIDPTQLARQNGHNQLPGIEDCLEKAERYTLYREKFEELEEGCQKLLKLVIAGCSADAIREQMGFRSANYAQKRKHICKKRLLALISGDRRYKELSNRS
ncbi:MAG: sigma-70 family RNA polymerase sigma factor [Lewinella sp.]|nr:sigma-70 family RNA polymerase sigma factor [Lewinella sp.]